MKIRKNDTVKILYGKDAGKTGKVLKIFPSEGKVVVEGMNIFKRHLKGDGRQRKSEIVDLIKPIPVAKVQLICPACKKPTRVGMENGERVCKKCSKKVGDVIAAEKKEKKVDTKKTEPKKKVIKKKAKTTKK
jgi:large subunit ribosomal protein L24